MKRIDSILPPPPPAVNFLQYANLGASPVKVDRRLETEATAEAAARLGVVAGQGRLFGLEAARYDPTRRTLFRYWPDGMEMTNT